MVGTTGEGGEYTARTGATYLEVSAVSSSMQPDAGVDALEIKMFKLHVYTCMCS